MNSNESARSRKKHSTQFNSSADRTTLSMPDTPPDPRLGANRLRNQHEPEPTIAVSIQCRVLSAHRFFATTTSRCPQTPQPLTATTHSPRPISSLWSNNSAHSAHESTNSRPKRKYSNGRSKRSPSASTNSRSESTRTTRPARTSRRTRPRPTQRRRKQRRSPALPAPKPAKLKRHSRRAKAMRQPTRRHSCPVTSSLRRVHWTSSRTAASTRSSNALSTTVASKTPTEHYWSPNAGRSSQPSEPLVRVCSSLATTYGQP